MKMKTKYDWSNIPKEVKWIATDKNGEAWFWETKPEIYCNGWLTGEPNAIDFIDKSDNPYKGNWRDSLEERPNEH